MDDKKMIGYLGQPNNLTKKDELSKWARFKKWIVPWLRAKALKADMYVDAELQQKVAQAEKTQAEAEKTRAEAAKIQAETAKIALEIEQEKIEILEKRQNMQETIDISYQKEELKKKIEESINTLRVVHRGDIIVKDGENLDQEETD